MNHGLPAPAVVAIHGVFSHFPALESAVLYGSRAKGNYKPGSDIDLTLHGKDLTTATLADIADKLEDLLLPYTFDLSIFATLGHPELRDHIERVGVVFYERKPDAGSAAVLGNIKGLL